MGAFAVVCMNLLAREYVWRVTGAPALAIIVGGWLIFGSLLGVWAGSVARKKGKSFGGFFAITLALSLCGIVGGLIGVVIAYAMNPAPGYGPQAQQAPGAVPPAPGQQPYQAPAYPPPTTGAAPQPPVYSPTPGQGPYAPPSPQQQYPGGPPQAPGQGGGTPPQPPPPQAPGQGGGTPPQPPPPPPPAGR